MQKSQDRQIRWLKVTSLMMGLLFLAMVMVQNANLTFASFWTDDESRHSPTQGQITKATERLRLIETALLVQPTAVDLLFEKAYWLEYLGDREEALAIKEEIRKIDPNNPHL
jgi:hypothetical protein